MEKGLQGTVCGECPARSRCSSYGTPRIRAIILMCKALLTSFTSPFPYSKRMGCKSDNLIASYQYEGHQALREKHRTSSFLADVLPWGERIIEAHSESARGPRHRQLGKQGGGDGSGERSMGRELVGKARPLRATVLRSPRKMGSYMLASQPQLRQKPERKADPKILHTYGLVQPAARGPHASRVGFECGPTQVRKLS